MRPRTAIITGATRGIGEALALALSKPGARLLLIGRDGDRLRLVAAACTERGATVETAALDVRDRAGMSETLGAFDVRHPADLVVSNAGIAVPTTDDDALATGYDEIEVNFVGALNTVLPLVSPMTARGRGQIALVSSLAALAPLAASPGYSGSKAGLLVYGLALRERLRPRGVAVNVVCPGYVDTAMGDRFGSWRPLTLGADEAARRILHGLHRDRAVVAFPRRLALAARVSTLVPEPVMRLGMRVFGFGRGG